MRRFFISWCFALLAIVTVDAQQIAEVSSSGETTMYETLQAAIEGAKDGSMVYLPGGTFAITDDVKITKGMTIIGVSHKVNSANVDGNTTISGNLSFDEGSSNSAIMGCYITGNVNIGSEQSAVSHIVVRYCNLNAVMVKNAQCMDIIVSRNYIRSVSNFGNAHEMISITNNILYSVESLDGGTIANNIITRNDGKRYSDIVANNTTIFGNVIFVRPGHTIDVDYRIHSGSNCQVWNNMTRENWGDDCVVVSEDWSNVFEKNNGISSFSNYHFTEKYKEYENKIGIYAGSGFSDSALPPVPYITEKEIPEQTDASGKLNIKIKVKAGE